ncbi:ATP-dependent RNA helicase DHX36 [Mytilus galloprovincialis]|nr:ATP-dependent RNA helicase DHX36 [Mytilus galloprovincialis]
MLKIFSNLCLKNNIIHRMNYRGRGGGRRGYIRDRPGNHDQDEEEGGHNNWRGHRQRRQGQRQYDDERQGHRQYDDGRQGHRQYDDRNHDRRDFRGRGRGRGGRPPGLRGKEIGLFYARQGKEKKQREEIEQRPEVSMQGKEDHIQKMLADIENLESDDKLSSGASFSGRKRPDTHRSETAFSSFSDKTDDTTQEDEVTEVPDLDQMFKLTQQEQDLILEEWNEEMDTREEDEISLDDQKMIKDLNDKSKNSRYLRMMEFRKKLPSYDMREEVVSVVNSSQVTVISGETGCGKTTQVPQFILDDCIQKGQGSKCHIICTQPRRISAVSVAQRVADERAEACGKGNSVGYSIRLERETPRSKGSILFCTTGILIKYLESDPSLIRASHIIIDEIHERDLLSDFLMIILKDLLPKRPDLKIILMSATLNAEQFSKYFNNCPKLNIPGFTFPVTEYRLEDVLEMTKYTPPSAKKKKVRHGPKFKQDRDEADLNQWNMDAWCRNLEGYSRQTIQSLKDMDLELIDLDLIHSLIRHIVYKLEEGAILVFVPGWEQISKLHKLLNNDRMFTSGKFKIIPLHSLMPTINQKEVFNRPPPGVRKIVIATNIAETSITIDDVVFVIDCGKIKVKDFHPEQNMTTLEAEWVSRANARQRRGRAGRVQAGHCFHLFTSLKETELRDYIPPEILRTRLEELCLQIKLLKLGKIEPFINKAMEKPSLQAVHKSIAMLQNLQALDEDENLLPLGYHLARMPVDPQSGKMILFGAMFGCLDPVCIVAASLSFKDAFYIPLGKEKEADRTRVRLSEGSQSDHIMLINAFQGWERSKARGNDRQYCYDNFLSGNTLKLLADMKRQFAELLHDLGFVANRDPRDKEVNINSDNIGLVKAVICAGLYPNVAKLTNVPRSMEKSPNLTLHDGQKVAAHPKSVNANEKVFMSKWFVYHTIMKTSKIWVYDMTGISPYALLFFGGKISTEEQLWNDEMKDVVVIDNWVRFWCPAETAVLVKKLRKQLDKLLEEKITQTGVTNWDKNSKEGVLMHAITDLITMEEENISNG